MKSELSWESYFMAIAYISSFRSKDPKTKTGACIVNNKKRIIGIGYNGLPNGCEDSIEYWIDENDNNPLKSKHTYVVHAEQNAIYNCTSNMEGCIIFTTLFPCNLCAQAIIQVGIKKVVYLNTKEHHENMNRAVMKMFNHVGVTTSHYFVDVQSQLLKVLNNATN